MNIAILAMDNCLHTLNIVKYFKQKGLPIRLVILQSNGANKINENVRKFDEAHKQFHLYINRNSLEYTKNSTSELKPSYQSKLKKWMPRGIFDQFRYLKKSYTLLEKNQFFDKLITDHVNVAWVKEHSSKNTLKLLSMNSIDYILFGSSLKLLKYPILIPGIKILNAHPAKLPNHRSLDSMPWSVMENDELGITTHYIDAGIDTGEILKFYDIKPEANENLYTYRKKLDNNIPFTYYDTLVGIIDGSIKPKHQKIEEGIYHRPMSFNELKLANQLFIERINDTRLDV